MLAIVASRVESNSAWVCWASRPSVRAREKLGWRPRCSFDELVGRMVDADLELARKEQVLVVAGHEGTIPNR